jgi:hypothetical protein
MSSVMPPPRLRLRLRPTTPPAASPIEELLDNLIILFRVPPDAAELLLTVVLALVVMVGDRLESPGAGVKSDVGRKDDGIAAAPAASVLGGGFVV